MKRKEEVLFWTMQSVLGEQVAFPAVGQIDSDEMIGGYRTNRSNQVSGFDYYAIDLETGLCVARGKNWKDLRESVTENWCKIKKIRAGKDYATLKAIFANLVFEALVVEKKILSAIEEGRKKA